MTVKDRVKAFCKAENSTVSAFEANIGVANGYVNAISKSIGLDKIRIILEKYPNLNIEWLLVGNGEMHKQYNSPTTSVKTAHEQEAIPLAEMTEKSRVAPIPLVTETAAAGFGNEHFSIAEKDVKEYYVIPKFRFCHVDFMIEVSGLSMYPHFNPGDVIACTILNDRKFLQWNKCHVIATREQGILVKRIMPGKNEGYLTAVSDNKEYPPFDIPVDDITGLALVVGSVSLE